MAPSLWVCTALIVAAVVGVSEGGLSEQGAELLSTLAKDKGVRAVALEDNFLYIRELAKGAPDGPTPNITSPCNVSYVAKLVDGYAFDGTTYPKTMTPGSVFKPFQAALMMMRPGDKWEVTVPPELAYGDKAVGAIPAGSVLVFMIEVHDVFPEPAGLSGVWAWVMRNPLWVMVGMYGLKMLGDWYLNVIPAPTSVRLPLDMIQGQSFNDRIHLDVSINGKSSGTIVCELFSRHVPKTSEMFRAVSCNDPPNVKKGRPNNRFDAIAADDVKKGRLCFRAVNTLGTVAPDFEGVPVLPETGKGYFAHEKRYLLSLSDAHKVDEDKVMEFFITLGKASHWDGPYVVFGAVVEGQGIVDELENARREDKPVVITRGKFVGGKKEQ